MNVDLMIQRPTDETWKALAALCSEADEQADNGKEPDEIFLEATGMVLDEFLSGTAQYQIGELVMAGKETPGINMRLMLIGAWTGGFGEGVNNVRGIDLESIPHDDRVKSMEDRMYAGVNKESVDYVSDQRSMRIHSLFNMESPKDVLVSLMVAYVDGYQCGYQYGKDN